MAHINKTPSLDDLELFSQVIRHQSFAACAAHLGVSPAYVSKRLKMLEERLGVKLMHRTTRRVSLTEVGETVAEWGQRVLDQAQELVDAVSEEQSVPRGLLRVCSSSGFGRNQVAPALSDLARRYPELEIQLELLDRRVDLVGEGFHLDIRLGEVNEPGLIVRRIKHNVRILCASPNYLKAHTPINKLLDLARHNCLVIRERDQQVGRWILTGPHGEESVKVDGALSCSNGEVVREWALDGHGVALRSQWDVQSLLDSGGLVRVLPDYEQAAHVYAVFPSRLASSARLRVCVEALTTWICRAEAKRGLAPEI